MENESYVRSSNEGRRLLRFKGALRAQAWDDSLLRQWAGVSAGVPSRDSAFTVIEITAVLAVIAILAAVIAPTIIRRVDRAAWTVGTANLSNIAGSFTQSILRTKTIPQPRGCERENVV